MNFLPTERGLPEQPVTLAEAARRFQRLGRGPSRTTLSRDASADRLNDCRDMRASRVRPLYRFHALCSLYGVDPKAPPPPPASSPKGRAQAAAPVAGAGAEEIASLRQDLANLTGEVGAMRKVLDGFVRDLDQVRRTLQLKYDAENGMLRQRLEIAEERVRQAAGLDSLSREMTALRQQINRLNDRLPAAQPE